MSSDQLANNKLTMPVNRNGYDHALFLLTASLTCVDVQRDPPIIAANAQGDIAQVSFGHYAFYDSEL